MARASCSGRCPLGARSVTVSYSSLRKRAVTLPVTAIAERNDGATSVGRSMEDGGMLYSCKRRKRRKIYWVNLHADPASSKTLCVFIFSTWVTFARAWAYLRRISTQECLISADNA